MMVKLMCGAGLKSRISSNDSNKRLNVEAVTDVVRQGRLRWFGHLKHKDSNDWVSFCRSFEVVGAKCEDRSRKTWGKCTRGHEIAWSEDRMGAGQGEMERTQREPSNPC